MVNFRSAAVAAVAALTGLAQAQSGATPEPELVNIESDSVVGGLYRPVNSSTPKASIGVMVMHAESNYISFSVCKQLSARGYTVLCANTPGSRYMGDTDVDFESMMTAVSAGVDYLYRRREIEKVVLWGHSGGGAMMSAYQNVAENGQSACNGTEKLYACSSAMNDLTAADGVILVDANYGMPTMFMLSLAPEIIDETTGMKTDYNLSLYNPANGFNATGASTYTPAFTKAYQRGLARRMQANVAYAQERLAQIKAGNGSFSDDESMTIVHGAYGVEDNGFFSQDLQFLSHTEYEWPLLHKNGSTTTQIIHSVRIPVNYLTSDDAESYTNGAVKTTITRFLSGYGLRVDDDFGFNATGFKGVHWDSNNMVPIQAVRGIRSPLLTMGMTGHWEYLNAEKIKLNAVSNDTDIVFVEGAQHLIKTCSACESYPGQFGNTTKTAYDYMAQWLAKPGRFLE